MTQNKNLILLKVALGIFAVVSILYGIGMVFFSVSLVEMSGADPFDPNWIRWAGGTLIALGIGAILAFRNPAKQDVFVITIALGSLFTGLALLFQLIFEMQPEYVVSFSVLPCVLNLLMSVLLWWGRQQAKEILKRE